MSENGAFDSVDRGERQPVIRRAFGSRPNRWLYEDDIVRMDPEGIVVRRYYWPIGWKRIPYGEIENFTRRPLKLFQGQHRVHGMDIRGRWYSRDRHRGEKELAIDLDIGARIRPVLTPEDPDRVLEILSRQLGAEDPVRSEHLGDIETDEDPSNAGNDDPQDEPPDEAWLL